MKKKSAFTLIELLVVVAIISVLVAILVPVVTSGLDDTRTSVCATNLKTIGGAFRDYKTNKTLPSFPRLAVNGDVDDGLLNSNTLDSTNLGTNSMQNVWLLVDEAYVPATAFKCPGDGGYVTRTAGTKYGWTSTAEFSYGIQCPYNKSADGTTYTNLADPTLSTYKATWVFMADMNPGGAVDDGTTVVHSTHTEGFNYITRVGNVEFHSVLTGTTRSVVFGEEIYAVDGAVAGTTGSGYGASADDVVITPTDPLADRP